MKRILLPLLLIFAAITGYEAVSKHLLDSSSSIDFPSETTWEDILRDCRPDLYEKLDRLDPDGTNPFGAQERRDYMAEVNDALKVCLEKRLGTVQKIMGN